ncbi:MAG: hypothetical protein NC307_05515 [Roseburia sp.]|nr:hypothetical protein [Roseburia sp.]
MIELALLDETLPKVRFIKTGRSCMCLLDTGANICVWTRGLEEFMKVFPMSDRQVGKMATVSGFGGDGAKAPVYLVDCITFRSGRNTLSFRDLHIAITTNTRIGAELVLAMTTLRKNVYTFDMTSKKFRVEGKTAGILCDNEYYDGDLKRTVAVALSQEETETT